MFDLFRSREKGVRYLLGFLLGLVALSLVITLIPGYGTGMGPGREDQLIAEIGDEALTIEEVRQVASREMKGGTLPPGMAAIYVPMIANSMIADRAAVYLAKEKGFDLTEEQLAESIRTVVPQLYQDGKFVGRETYAAFLAQQNMTIAEFEDNVKKQVLMTRIQSVALEGVVVPPSDVEYEFRRRNEKLKVALMTLSPETFRSQATASIEEMQAVYERQKANYKTPEKRGYLIFPITEAAIAATIPTTEADLRRIYASQQDRYRTPERVRVRHILLKTTDKPKEEVEKIRLRAEDLLKQIKSGANFAELAKKNSEDPGSAVKGGDLDWVVRGQTVPEFEKSAFSLKVGETSALVTTMYGFHILRVEAKEEARLKPFEEVKAELAKETVRSQVFDKMQTLADQIRAALVRNPAEAMKLAADSGVKPVTVAPVKAGDPIPEIGANPQFQESANSLPKNGVTPVISVGADKLAIAQVTEIVPPGQAAFADVQDQIRSQIQADKGQKLFDAKVKEATEKAKTVNGDINALAKMFGADVKTPAEFARDGAVEGAGAAIVFEPGFSKNVGDLLGPIQTSLGTSFYKIVGKTEADLTQLAAQRDSLVQMLKGRRARERRELLMDGIVNQLIKEKKVKVYENNIKRLANAMQGA